LILVGLASIACTTIEPGEVAVMTSWGEIKPGQWPSGTYSEGPGTHYHKMSIRTQSFNMIGAPTADNSHERGGEGTVRIITKDQLSVNMDVTVQFHLNPDHANPIFRAFGAEYAPTVIHAQVRTAVRDAAGQFRALDLVEQRQTLQHAVESEVTKRIHALLSQQRISTNAIMLDGILIRDIDLPQSLDDSIANLQRERMTTQQRQQAALTAAQEAQRQMTEARGQIEAGLIRTRGNAEARRIEAEAEANANRIVAMSLTPEILRLRTIEANRAALTSSGTRTIILPSSSIPLLNLGNLVNTQ
jgi:regulator of protease activity HflC (stomatin/prohibitin superfamily)